MTLGGKIVATKIYLVAKRDILLPKFGDRNSYSASKLWYQNVLFATKINLIANELRGIKFGFPPTFLLPKTV